MSSVAFQYNDDDQAGRGHETMSQRWKEWVGRLVDGKFPLESYLGGSDHSAVYVTQRRNDAGEMEKVAIKLIDADPAITEKQLTQWRSATKLSHPNLIRIFESGRAEVDGMAVLYVVEELAEEDLSQILPERALTAEETRGMLAPVLDVLRHLHDNDLAHGHIQPSNILARGDEVKLSSDRARELDPKAKSDDVRQLGMTLVEVLTQRAPSAGGMRPVLPEPFEEIVTHCLDSDAEQRWTVAEVGQRLAGERVVRESKATPVPTQIAAAPAAPVDVEPKSSSAKWLYALVGVAIVGLATFLVMRPKAGDHPAESTAPLVTQTAPAPAETSTAASSASPTAASVSEPADGVVKRVIPDVSPGAQRTIQGTIKVRVRVDVDAAGNVTKAKIESGRASRYFKRLSEEAARDWKFSPAAAGETGTRRWHLQFDFNRRGTDASAAQGKP